ncbi:hypothetical protein [Sphingomonas sp.]|jgi:hypothetical protein|uniref:hypothetical protein n=1 Tax=Sphingomonas sp. TaxID=28214 RepID=UPI0017CD70EE|nr:hypothetical protein [Sphingomonas sp.]MBA4763698.1 hypothetical protein [Sphingomonas sp.]
MRDDTIPAQDSAAVEAQTLAAWSAPTVAELPVAELTQGVGGPNFDGDFSPQS